ncbi:MAG TPA: phosphatase PAP2 family protein [Calditrichia bacterium]|nr:phosphatase PAP2 family protein [Calditrichia bacterium]
MRWVALIHQLDLRLFLWIFDLNGKMLRDRFFTAVSRSADGYWYAPAALLVLWMDLEKGATLVLAGSMAFLLELPTYYLLKTNIRRKRPFEAIGSIEFLVAPPDRFSFPSGHTAASFIMVFLIGALFPDTFLPLLGWGLLVGFSRVYLGVHYPGDVLAGATIGILSAFIGLELENLLPF